MGIGGTIDNFLNWIQDNATVNKHSGDPLCAFFGVLHVSVFNSKECAIKTCPPSPQSPAKGTPPAGVCCLTWPVSCSPTEQRTRGVNGTHWEPVALPFHSTMSLPRAGYSHSRLWGLPSCARSQRPRWGSCLSEEWQNQWSWWCLRPKQPANKEALVNSPSVPG